MPAKKLRTLFLDSNGVGRTVITTDTVLRGVFGLKDGATAPPWLQKYPYIVNLYAHLCQFNDNLSYIADWRDAFCNSPRLDVEICNMNNLVHLSKCILRIRRYDLIVVSHVAAGDDMTFIGRLASALSL